MKTYLSLIAAAAFALAACSSEAPKEETAPAAEATSEAAPAEAAPQDVATDAAPAADAQCEQVVESTDQMTFNAKEIIISSGCQIFKLTLKHTGTMPKSSMGHNIVITKAADESAVLQDGSAAGLDNGFVKANDDRVIAHTDLIGGGEESTVEIDTSKLQAGEDYSFFCSFPGHAAIMKGKVAVK